MTQKEVVYTNKEGTGKARAYEVLDSPDADTIMLKFSDGEVVSFHREGERFWTESTLTGGVVPLKTRVYYTRAK